MAVSITYVSFRCSVVATNDEWTVAIVALVVFDNHLDVHAGRGAFAMDIMRRLMRIPLGADMESAFKNAREHKRKVDSCCVSPTIAPCTLIFPNILSTFSYLMNPYLFLPSLALSTSVLENTLYLTTIYFACKRKILKPIQSVLQLTIHCRTDDCCTGHAGNRDPSFPI